MAVRGSNSLFFASGIDNSGLKQGTLDAIGLVQGMASTISKISPFAALSIGAATAFAKIANDAFKMMNEFEHAMKEVQTISKATQEDFEGISSAVFALSKISPDAPVKLAKAYYQIVSAGYDGAAGLELLETAAKAATAGVTDTATAADGITTVLNAFKLEASEAEKVADIMFNTVRLGKTTFEELSRSLSEVAPLAAASGFNFEEVAAAVATLTKQGVPTSQAMTQIRSAIEAVGEVLGDGAAKSMTLQNAFQAIYDQAKGSQTGIKELTGRMEAMNAILAIAGPNAKGAAADLQEMANAAGSAEVAFDRMAGSNVNQWQILTNRIKAYTEELGNSLVEVSSDFAGFVNDFLDDTESITTAVRREANEFRILKTTLEDSNTPFEEKLDILVKLKNQYPEYLSSLEINKINEDNLEKSLLNVRDALREINDEQERRLRTSGASLRRDEAQAARDELRGIYEDTQSEFFSIIEDIKKYAAEEGIDLNFSYSDDISKIYRDIQKQIGDVNPFGEGGRLIANLSQAESGVRIFRAQLGEANQELEETNKNLDLVKRNTYDNANGYKQIVKEIESINKLSDLSQYDDYEYSAIQEAFKARQEILQQFQQIDQVQKLESLKPFLDSEIAEIREYAEKRKRYINTDFSGGGGDAATELDKYKDFLKQREKAYQEYEAAVIQLGKESADAQNQELLKQGENYGVFLQNQLNKTQNFAKQTAIAVAAQNNGINLNRPQVQGVSSIQSQPIILDLKLDQTSINFINRQLDELRAKFDAATTDTDRNAIRERIKYWEERLKIAEGGTDREKSLYEDVQRTLSNLSYKSLRDYISYWQKRLETAEKGSEREREIEGKISDGQRALWQKRIDDVTGKLRQTSEILRKLGEDSAADLVDGLASAAGSLEDIFTIMDDNTSKEGKIQAGIGAAIQLTDMLISSAQQRKKAEEDYYNSVIAQQKEYNQLLNEQIRTQEGANDNVFTKDYINQIETGLASLSDANTKFEDSLDALSEGAAKTGMRNKVDWGNALSGAGSGAAVGAAIGSVVPVIGTVIGGVVGAVGGFLGGLFGGKKKAPEWNALLQEYPELLDRSKEGAEQFNSELAQTLLNQDLVNDKTKTLIQDTLDWIDAIEEANEQIKEVIGELAGTLGSDLRNSLVDAFQAGEDAAIAMGDTISGVLENILSQLIFDKIFSEQFKKLEDEMANSFDVGGDRSWQDDFARFFEAAQGLTDDFNNELEAARQTALNNGFDIFGPSSGSNRNGLAGGIQNITEDTAGAIEGYMNAVRIDVRDRLILARQELTISQQGVVHLSEIAVNTRYNRYLESIDNRMSTIESGILEFQSRN